MRNSHSNLSLILYIHANARQNELSKSGFKLTNTVEYWSEFLCQPFSPPPTFNVDKIISIAQSKMDDAGDHLWLMQTDPAYMRRIIANIGQGYDRRLLPVHGQNYYPFIAQQLYHDFQSFLNWTWIRDECQNIKDVLIRCRGSYLPGDALPLELDRALSACELITVNRLHFNLQHIKFRFNELSGFFDNWTIEYRDGVSRFTKKAWKTHE